MDNDDTMLRCLLWLGYRHYIGMWKYKTLQAARMSYLKSIGWRGLCSICGEAVNQNKNRRSVDHIVPVSICLELNMPGLIFDIRNFRLAHQKCNQRRGNSTDDLPDSIKKLLAGKRNKLYTDSN